MGKKSQKISRKLKAKKLEKAIEERKKRKKLKLKNVSAETKPVNFSPILRKNIMPLAVLVTGCLVFYISTQASFALFNFRQFVVKKAIADEPGQIKTEMKEVKVAVNISTSQKGHSKLLEAIPLSDSVDWMETGFTEADFVLDANDQAIDLDSEFGRAKKEREAESAKISITPVKEEKAKVYPLISYAGKDALENAEDFKAVIDKILQDTPMSDMTDDILKRDRAVAAFLLGIGMKESKYGIYSPKKEGVECYNYWGYRGKENQTKSGYSCFDSPAHAVQVVGNRIENLVKRGLDTPDKMIVWKCGSSCAGHSAESVDKWIADVSINYYRLNPARLLTKK